MKNLMETLITHTSREPNGWTHTPSLRGMEKRLTAKILNAATRGRGSSLEKIAYSAGEPMSVDVEPEANDASLSPGTFIETRR